jgi:hypothetical protein
LFEFRKTKFVVDIRLVNEKVAVFLSLDDTADDGRFAQLRYKWVLTVDIEKIVYRVRKRNTIADELSCLSLFVEVLCLSSCKVATQFVEQLSVREGSHPFPIIAHEL